MGLGLHGFSQRTYFLPSRSGPCRARLPWRVRLWVGPPLAPPSRGAGGPLRFVLLPPVSAAFWLFLFCVLVRDHSWMRGAIPRSDVGTHIGSRFSTLAKRASGSLKGLVRENQNDTRRYQRQLRLASSTQQVVERGSGAGTDLRPLRNRRRCPWKPLIGN